MHFVNLILHMYVETTAANSTAESGNTTATASEASNSTTAAGLTIGEFTKKNSQM